MLFKFRLSSLSGRGGFSHKQLTASFLYYIKLSYRSIIMHFPWVGEGTDHTGEALPPQMSELRTSLQ